MASGSTVSIAIVADASKATAAFNSTGDSATRMGRQVESAGRNVDDLGERADQSATRFSTLGGAVGDVTGAFVNVKGPVGAFANTINGLTPFIMLGAGAADILSLALTSNAFASIRAGAATVGSKVAMVASTAATYGLAAATYVLDAALALNPIGIVVIALIALVAGLVLAYNKSETFRNIVTGAFTAIKDAAVAVFDFVVDFISGAVDKIVAVFDFIVALPGKIADAGRNIVSGLINGILDSIPGLRRAVEFLANLLPGSVKNALGIGDLKVSGTVSSSAVSAAGSGGGSTTNITVNGGLGTKAEVGAAVSSALDAHRRRGGLA